MMIKEGSLLWQYLSKNQRVLVQDGMFLLEDSYVHEDREPTDYSYMVFPFAKLYEGFLKQLFLDLDIINQHDYTSDHFRIGKALSPNMARVLRRSALRQIGQRYGRDLALLLWETWKEGRNLVFHYFPHNYRSLDKSQAETVIRRIVETMEEAVRVTHVKPNTRDDSRDEIQLATETDTQ